MSGRPAVIVLVTAVLTACTAGRGGLDPQLTPGTGGRDVLFAADLVRSHASTLYDAILEVRPDFFERQPRLRIFEQAQPLHVFVNGVDMGDIEALHGLPLAPVTSVR